MGIFVEFVYFYICQYVFKNRKVCKLSRELFSFFPPHNCIWKATVRRHIANLVVRKGGQDFSDSSFFVIEFYLTFTKTPRPIKPQVFYCLSLIYYLISVT